MCLLHVVSMFDFLQTSYSRDHFIGLIATGSGGRERVKFLPQNKGSSPSLKSLQSHRRREGRRRDPGSGPEGPDPWGAGGGVNLQLH